MLHCHQSRRQPLCWLRRSLRCAPSFCGALTALPVCLVAPLRRVVSDHHPALQQLARVELILRKVLVETWVVRGICFQTLGHTRPSQMSAPANVSWRRMLAASSCCAS